MKYMPVTGNLYKETFSDEGVRYVNYYVDCAECGIEVGVDGFGRGHTATNRVKKWGWRKVLYSVDGHEDKKWVCPDCT